MSSIEDKLVEEVSKFAIEQKKKWENNQKIIDYHAIQLKIIVLCGTENEIFIPPLRVLINGERLAQEINSDISNADNFSEKNELLIWKKVPVRKNGADKISIVLEPIGEANKYFKKTKSEKSQYESQYSRNQTEELGREFVVPPKEIEPGNIKYQVHNVRIKINLKKKLWGLRKIDIPEKWKLKKTSIENDISGN